ncbi:hypothetical protein AMTRI_Chr06g194960 [Amborella trichopoda]
MPQEKTTAERVEQELIVGKSFKSMKFVQSISEKDEQLERKKKDFVHFHRSTIIPLLPGSCLSWYAAAATEEHVERSTRNLAMKSVVMKVKRKTYLWEKKVVILSLRERYTFVECKRSGGVGDKYFIMYIHDVTQLPHDGC